jgi:hypothetical protein
MSLVWNISSRSCFFVIHLAPDKSRAFPIGVRRDQKEGLKGNLNFVGGFNRVKLLTGERRSVCSCVGLWPLGAAPSYYY